MGNVKDEPKLWNGIVEDGLDPTKWEMTDFVPMAYNRCVAFQSKHYHSRWPATNLKNERLIKVFFYKL